MEMNPSVPVSEPARSRFGTFRDWGLDWSGFSLRSGWDTVEAFGRRVCGLAALALLCAAVNPVWLPSQTPMQYEMKADLASATRRLDTLEAKLSTVPTDVAVMKEQIARLNETVENFSSRWWGMVLAGIAWVCRQLFMEFGGREKRGRA